MPNLLNQEFQTFEKHKSDLLSDNVGRFVLIKGDQIIDIFDTQLDAVRQGYKRFGNVPFLAKKIVAVEDIIHFSNGLLRS